MCFVFFCRRTDLFSHSISYVCLSCSCLSSLLPPHPVQSIPPLSATLHLDIIASLSRLRTTYYSTSHHPRFCIAGFSSSGDFPRVRVRLYMYIYICSPPTLAGGEGEGEEARLLSSSLLGPTFPFALLAELGACISTI